MAIGEVIGLHCLYYWALSLVGRAPHLQCGGHRFESDRVHGLWQLREVAPMGIGVRSTQYEKQRDF